MSSEDISMITEILAGYTNPSNEIRSKAEIKLNELRQNLGAITYCLLSVTSNHSLQMQLRKTALVLLRKILMKDYNKNWGGINPNLKAEIKAISIKLFLDETDAYLKQKYCDVISELINITSEKKEQWTEIHELTIALYTTTPFPIISTQDDVIQMKTIISLLKNSIVFFSEDIEVNMENFSLFIQFLFKNPSIELKVSCSELIEEFLSMCDTEAVTEIPLFLCSIHELALECFNNKDEANLLKIILIIGEISENRSDFMLFIFEDILSLVSLVTKKTEVTIQFKEREKICEAAFELEMIIIELEPKIFQEKKEYLSRCIMDLYSYAFEMPRDISNEWLHPIVNNFESLDIIAEDQVRFVHEIFNRLLIQFKAGDCQMIILYYAKEMLSNDSNWLFVYIGLISISQIMYYMDSIDLIKDCIPFFNKMLMSPNSKIRLAAANCIDQLADTFPCNYTDNDINQAILMLTSLSLNEEVPCVQCKFLIAASTFICNIENKKALNTINQAILDNLLKLFLKEDISLMTRREVLNTIKNLIDEIESDCASYADTILQILMKYFAMIYQKGENRCLYGILLDNITSLGIYTENSYSVYVPDIIKAIISIVDSMKENINPMRNHIQNSIDKLLPIAMNKYKEMIPALIKSVLSLLKSLKELMQKEKTEGKTDKEGDNNDDDDMEEDDDKDKDKATSDPDDYVDCIRLLETFVESLEEKFLCYYKEFNLDLLEIYTMTKTPKIKSNTANLFAKLIEIMPDSIERNNEAKRYISMIMTSIEETSFHHSNALLFSSMESILETIGLVLTKDEVHQLFEKVVLRYEQYELARIDLISLRSKKQSDTIESYSERIKDYENAQMQMMGLIGNLIKIYKIISHEMINVCINKIIPSYINKDQSAAFSQQMMIFLVDDLIEYLGEEYFTSDQWPFLFNVLVTSVKYKTKPLIRGLSYGIGLFARMTSDKNYEVYAPLSVQVLMELFKEMNETKPNTKKNKNKNKKKLKENQLAMDNITAALGKIIKYKSTSSFIQTNLIDIINSWVINLPINEDTSEMEEQHELLCQMIMNNNGEIIKKSNGIAIIQSLLIIYKTKKSNYTIDRQIEQIFKAIKGDKSIQMNMEKMYLQKDSPEDIKKKMEALIK